MNEDLLLALSAVTTPGQYAEPPWQHHRWQEQVSVTFLQTLLVPNLSGSLGESNGFFALGRAMLL